MEDQSNGSKKVKYLGVIADENFTWNEKYKNLKRHNQKCPFVPAEIKEHTTANKIGSGVQGLARESFEIQRSTLGCPGVGWFVKQKA